MSKEQIYYELLSRTDHTVFYKDFSPTASIDGNAPLNQILNLVYARQIVKLKALIDEVKLNAFPMTVTALTIADWELDYFGFVKGSLPLAQRVSEIMTKFNRRFSMSVPDVMGLSQSIVGSTPVVIRNMENAGFVLGRAVLGISTVMGGESTGTFVYLVSFTKPINSTLLNQLDQALTLIEKAGCTHKVKAPTQFWILGQVPLGINTTLGA
jgi:hypothetical protein